MHLFRWNTKPPPWRLTNGYRIIVLHLWHFTITLNLSLISGILILIMPRLLNYMREWIWNQVREGNAKWVPTGTRHTFASCYYAKFESVDNLLKQLGHGSTDMLRKSYKRAVPKEEAEKFWSIFPPKQEEQRVIAFPGV